ncbi:hypothetical protein QCA50_012484 [Cerrena zonata]|uniref:Uncharacterized protein n=1 Tax=Cerrena zonata TaxID=2478898 RepID=A0AAW0G4P2_9APHY
MALLSTSSPPPSPLQSQFSSAKASSPPKSPGSLLRFPHVVNLLVKMRRTKTKAKSHHIESSSGDQPYTHPSLAGEGVTSARKVPLYTEERYNCKDGVDVAKLLRTTRASLLEKAEAIGANALVNEEWTTTVCGPRHRRDGSFRVYVNYGAHAVRSTVADPGKPPVLENARGVPGLMTVLSRDE